MTMTTSKSPDATTGDGSGIGSGNVQHRIVARMDGVGQNADGSGGTSTNSVGTATTGNSTGNTSNIAAGRRSKAKVTPPATPPATRRSSFMAAEEEEDKQQQQGGVRESDHNRDDDDEKHDEDDVLHDVPVDHHHNYHAAAAAAAHEGEGEGDGDNDNDDDSLDRLMDLESSSSYTVKTSNTRGDASGSNGAVAAVAAAAGVVAGASGRPAGKSSPITSNSKPQTFDIEMSGPDSPDSYDDDEQHPSSTGQAICCLSTYCCRCLPPCYKIGNTTILLPSLYERTGKYGVIGPHWPGLVATLGLLGGASYYYTTRAFVIGPISGGICVLMTAVCTVLLFGVALCDPGMITTMRSGSSGGGGGGGGRASAGGGGGKYAGLPTDGRDLSDWRYCDLCAVYQPPDAVHCPDCQVCVEGHDHHCPWMGTCIGKRNMRAFVLFNLSWLFYLLYAVGWVTFGPLVTGAGAGAGDFGDGAGGGNNSTAADAGGDKFR